MSRVTSLIGALVAVVLLLLIAPPASAEGEQWAQIGPTAGDIYSLAISPADPAILYAGTNCGIFRSSDGGAGWRPVTPGLACSSIGPLAADPTDAAVVYAGVGAAIRKSADGGDTWITLLQLDRNNYASSFTFDPAAPGTLYAATAQGAYRSVDSGATWNRLSGPGSGRIRMIAVDPTTPTILYAATESGIFRSLNGGEEWRPANDGLSDPQPYATAILADPTAPATLYAVANGAVYKSADGGDSWIEKSYGVSSIALDPTSPDALYAVKWGTIFKSADRGESWLQVGLNTGYVPATALVVDPVTPGVLYLGTLLQGVLKSVDGGVQWDRAVSGLKTARIRRLCAEPGSATTVYAATYNGALFKSIDGGADWVALPGLPGPDISAFAIDPATPSNLYAGTLDGVYKSADGGNTWSKASVGLKSPFSSVLAVDPVTPSTLYVGANSVGVYKSTNGGASWSASNLGLGSLDVMTLAIDPTAPSTLYAGTDGGGVFKSTDGGGTWRWANSGLTDKTVAALAIDPATPGTVYAGTWLSGVFKSTDGGASWKQVTGYLWVEALAIDPSNPATIYAGTVSNTYNGAVGGVYRSVDGGATWELYGSGLTDAIIEAIAIDPGNPSRPYAGTWGAGVVKILSPPGAPTGAAGASGNASATVSFTAPNSGGSRITTYTVTSSPGGVTASGSAGPITVPGLVNGTAYTFTVSATNAMGAGPASSPSPTVTPRTVPGAPTAVTATAGDGHAVVRFTPPSDDGGSPITSYTVTSSGNVVATGGAGPIIVTGLTNGSSYTFTVTATNAAGAGAASSRSTVVTPMTVPGAPTEVTVVAGNGLAVVRFKPPSSDGGSAITSFTVTSSGVVVATGASSPIVVTGLQNGAPCVFTVRATNAAGTGAPSPPSASVTPMPEITVNDGDGYAASRKVALLLNYHGAAAMQFRVDGAKWGAWVRYAAARSLSIPGADGLRTVSVRFRDAEGAVSPAYSATILLDTKPPTDGVLSTARGAGGVILRWEGAFDPSGIEGYRLVVGTGGYPSCAALPLYQGPGASYVHEGTIPGKTYYYRLCAMDTTGRLSAGAKARLKAP